MDLIDRLRDLGARSAQVALQLQTEEATKNALVMPFINALGYNVFDPTEVIPEFTADVGIKKGEKVDYAICRDGRPIMLLECKTIGTELDRVTPSQLYRYFSVTEARFGILTNGIHYRFFSDLEAPNKMDSKPFLEFDITRAGDDISKELKKFTKEAFDLENILSTASELKYTKGIVRVLTEEWINPSEEFVKLLTSRVYSGRMTQAVRDQFTEITKRAFHEFVTVHINRRLKSALEQESVSDVSTTGSQDTSGSEQDDCRKVVTTNDELEAFYVVKSLVRDVVDPARIFMRDTLSYCGVLLDDNNRKPICRLFLNSSRKYIGLFDDQKHVVRHPIDSVNDIYRFSDELRLAAQRFDASPERPSEG